MQIESSSTINFVDDWADCKLGVDLIYPFEVPTFEQNMRIYFCLFLIYHVDD